LWQEGAQIAEAAADPNQVVVFIVRLFTAPAMTDDRIAQTGKASAQDPRPARLDPNRLRGCSAAAQNRDLDTFVCRD
jgi:hypothetical protein